MIKKVKYAAVIFTAAAAVITAAAIIYDKNVHSEQSFDTFAMDTVCSVRIYGADGEYADGVKSLISDLDESLSAYNESSPICKANVYSEAAADGYTAQILERAVELSEEYEEVNCLSGALIDLWDVGGDNPDVPSEEDINSALATIDPDNLSFDGETLRLKNGAKLNFGCCAKGYALDVISDSLSESKAECAIVSFGSSSLMYGKKPDGTKFTTAVTDPENAASTLLTFETDACFISTSGGYERYFEVNGTVYSHIFDLTTGYPAVTDLTSVTVISENDGMLTDFLSTAIYIGGTEKLYDYLENESYAVIAVDENHTVYCSESVRDSVELTSESYSLSEQNSD